MIKNEREKREDDKSLKELKSINTTTLSKS